MHQAKMEAAFIPVRTASGGEAANKAKLKSLADRLPLGVGFFLLSLAQCLGVPSPYTICFLAALLSAGVKPVGAIPGLAAGLAFRVLWGLPWDLGQFAACLLCFPLLKTSREKQGQLLAVTGILLVLRSIPEIMTAQIPLTVILYAAGLIVGVAVTPALRRAALLWKMKAKELSADDILCLCLPGLFMLSGASRLMIGPINLGYWAAACAVTSISWLYGGAAGVCVGMGCGMALVLGGQSAMMLVNLAVSALFAGLFQGKKRYLTAGMALLSAVIMTYLAAHGFSLSLFLGELAGCAAFCLIPNRWMKKAGLWIRRLRWNHPRENAYIRLKMHRWVQAIDKMADALPHARMGEEQNTAEGEKLSEWLCADCVKMNECWGEQQAAATQEHFQTLTEPTEDQESELERINSLFSACERIGKLPSLLERLDEDRKRQARRVLCAEYERDMLQAHLTALSQAAQRLSLEGENSPEEDTYWTARLEETLQAMGFPGQTAFAKRVDGKWTVCLRFEPLSLHPKAGKEVAKRLGLQLGKTLTVAEQTGDRILLEEPPPLRLVTGVATASAAPREHKRSASRRTENGDAVLIQPLSGGKELLALSDGMGHGADACDESRKTLELLSLCMEAGYSRTQAMTVVNGTMLSATSGEKFATVDLCLVDLWSGEAAMNKLGACPSFLIQGQKIKTIEGSALPLGIIEHVIPMEYRFSLEEGDALVLVSDGVTDAFVQEDGILSILREQRDSTPQRLADAILGAALARRAGAPPDDMTVLCARVKERD